MMPAPVLADAAVVSAGDTAWVLASTALVMVMTVGLAFFYGGLVRPKNALNTMMMSMVALGLISVQWVLVGYSIGFGHGTPWWGGLAWAGFRGVGLDPDPAYAATIPLQAHAMFQAMFAIITPALISGAIVERMHFRAYVVFILLSATFVYDRLAPWAWGAGGAVIAGVGLDLGRTGKATAVGAATGLVVGLVGITPAAGYITVPASIAVGVLAVIVSYTAIQIRATTRLDDSLDVFSCHGLAGTAGAPLTRVVATKSANPARGGRWPAGNIPPMGVQLVAGRPGPPGP